MTLNVVNVVVGTDDKVVWPVVTDDISDDCALVVEVTKVKEEPWVVV